jgi:outer membrane receptor protein involved in Fe transport
MRRLLPSLFILLLIPVFGFSGTIKGVIKEPLTGEPAIGAVVSIAEDQSVNTVTGLDGSFQLKQLSAGTYTVEVRYMGTQPVNRQVTLTDDHDQVMNITLTPQDGKELQEVQVDGKRDGGTENTARTLEQKADQVMNIVSARAIQVSPDLTVANVIQRVSGISIERNSNGDGQYAILRGMDKRYNYTMVNGVKIPSPDNKYRYVPLDMFPAELLDRLEVYKALTPSMEGDAIGGAVNMVMKDAPSTLTLSANLATGYSELFANRDFTGYAYKDVNAQSPYELNDKKYSAKASDFNSAPYDYTSKKPMPNILGGLSVGNRFFNNKLGVILAGSYQNTYRGANSLLFDQETVDSFSGVTLTKRSERLYSEQQTRSGVHAKADYRFNARNKIQWYNAYLSLTNIQVRGAVDQLLTYGGYDPDKGNASLTYSTRSRLTRQSIYNSTLQGEHQLLNKLKLQWSAVYSLARREQPDNTTVSMYGTEQNFVQQITFPDDSQRKWEHNSDRDISGYLNFTYSQAIAGIPIDWMLGGVYRDKYRDNFYNQYQFRPLNPIEKYGKDFDQYSDIEWHVENPKGSVGSAQNYEAHEKIAAGYIQFKAMMKSLEVVGGVRAEHTDQGYDMYEQIGEDAPVGSQIYTDFLPSLHFRYTGIQNTNIRLSYYRSINRPGFSEIVPGPITNEEYTEKGNADLKHAVADNLDLRYELYPRAGEVLMAGIFYKHIKDPIEYTLQLDPVRKQDKYYMPGNFGNADNYGLELDFIKFFNKIGFKGNYTYTHSTITTQKFKRIRDAAGNIAPSYPEQTRPLYGQAAHIANLAIIFKDAKNGWDAQLAGNYTGNRIVTVSENLDADIWQKGFFQLDFSFEKTFKNHLGIFVKVNNILNTPMETYIKGKSDVNSKIPDQDLGDNTLIQRDFYQRSYLLGLRYKL